MNNKIIYGTGGMFGYKTEKKATAIIKYAYENGIFRFDTGSNYAFFKAEKLLGKCLNNLGIDLNNIEISTKYGTIYDKNKGSFVKDFSVENCIKTFEKSILNLNVKNLDCYYMHEPSHVFEKNIESCNYLEELKFQGRIKKWGIVAHEAKLIDSIINNWKILPDNLMIKCNLGNFIEQKYRIDKLYSMGLKIIAGTVLGQGSLLMNSKKINWELRDQIYYILRRKLKKESRKDFNYNKKLINSLKNCNPNLPKYSPFAYIYNQKMINSISFSSVRIDGIKEIIEMSKLNLSDNEVEFITNFLINFGKN